MATETIHREGTVHAKANKTDPVSQTWQVREWADGTQEYFHRQEGKWLLLPTEWAEHVTWQRVLQAK